MVPVAPRPWHLSFQRRSENLAIVALAVSPATNTGQSQSIAPFFSFLSIYKKLLSTCKYSQRNNGKQAGKKKNASWQMDENDFGGMKPWWKVFNSLAVSLRTPLRVSRCDPKDQYLGPYLFFGFSRQARCSPRGIRLSHLHGLELQLEAPVISIQPFTKMKLKSKNQRNLAQAGF